MNRATRSIYRWIYLYCGRLLRAALPSRTVEAIKRLVPSPEGIPGRLLTCLPAGRNTTASADVTTRPAGSVLHDIFILSIIDWDFRTQRPQHLAREMAKRGHRVFYLEMEAAHGDTETRMVAEGVWAVRFSRRGIGVLRTYNGVPDADQALAWLGHFEDFCVRNDASDLRQVIVQHPYWWNFTRHLGPDNRIVFDCMDDIAGFSNTEPHVLRAEEDLIAQCDRMIVSSQYLYDKYAPIRPVKLVRNGADLDHFIRAPETAPVPGCLRGRLRPISELRVGYVGAIAEWFDTETVRDLARSAPDFDIHLCGAVTAEAPLSLRHEANITLHGEIAYDDVPGFLAAMDVLIIPFKLLPIIKACDPVKFYEYAAMMRPTVATSMPELQRAGNLVVTASNGVEFAERIRAAAAAATPEFRKNLRDYALANSWSDRADAFLGHLAEVPKVSAVVLSYGPAELTKTAVHAMLGQGGVYENLEVVVVDNGSGEDTCADLREYLSRFPEARLIENGNNLGFAGGNNVGIAEATGDYVMLLNNDTYVAPGAIHAMVRHLERSQNIGVVGPLTNNIGNEARVSVDYADMDEMKRAARALTFGHRGQWSPVHVCAYFCVMFRREDLHRFGPLCEDYGRGMFEDDDHCAVIRATGYDCALAEDAFVHHHLSASFDTLGTEHKQRLFAANRDIFESRWGTWRPHRYRETRPASTMRQC